MKCQWQQFVEWWVCSLEVLFPQQHKKYEQRRQKKFLVNENVKTDEFYFTQIQTRKSLYTIEMFEYVCYVFIECILYKYVSWNGSECSKYLCVSMFAVQTEVKKSTNPTYIYMNVYVGGNKGT